MGGNDTIEESGGMIRIRLFHMKKNTDTDSFVIPFEVKPDQCVFLTDLNRFGQFLMNEHVLYAQAVDEKGKVLTEIMDYADIERHMEFPDCTLTLSWEGETLLVEPIGLREAWNYLERRRETFLDGSLRIIILTCFPEG